MIRALPRSTIQGRVCYNGPKLSDVPVVAVCTDSIWQRAQRCQLVWWSLSCWPTLRMRIQRQIPTPQQMRSPCTLQSSSGGRTAVSLLHSAWKSLKWITWILGTQEIWVEGTLCFCIMEAEKNLMLPITKCFSLANTSLVRLLFRKNVPNLFDKVFPKLFSDKAFVLFCKMKALNEKEKLNQRWQLCRKNTKNDSKESKFPTSNQDVDD